jgi:hypothetical protein
MMLIKECETLFGSKNVPKRETIAKKEDLLKQRGGITLC